MRMKKYQLEELNSISPCISAEDTLVHTKKERKKTQTEAN